MALTSEPHRRLIWLAGMIAVLALPVRSQPLPDIDSTAVDDASTLRRDPLWAWQDWPPIGRAIALEKLDGPADILEKSEIIADRLDGLVREETRLDSIGATWGTRHLALAAQLEVLEDLADVQLGGDLQLQQRIDRARDDALDADDRVARVSASREALQAEALRLRDLAADYRRRAEELRRQEEGSR